MKRYVLIFAALLLIISMVLSCDEKAPAEAVTDESSDESAASQSSSDNTDSGLASYVIVRGDTSSEAVTNAAVKLRHIIEDATGIKPELGTDWVKRGETPVQAEHEILIGETNRAQSISAYADLNGSTETLDYLIRADGDHYVIAATDFGADAAVEAFIDFLSLSKTEITMLHDYPIKTLTLGGVDIDKFIICADDNNETALKLSALIEEATGIKLDIAINSEAEHTIYIGDPALSGLLDFNMGMENGNLYLGGKSSYADTRAFYAFLSAAGLDGDIYSAAAEIAFDSERELHVTESRPLNIGAWCTSGDAFEMEEQFAELAEANFTQASIAKPSDDALLEKMLEWAAIYDIDVLWMDGSVYGAFDSDFSACDKYISAPNSWGNYICDEPNSSLFPILAKAYKTYSDRTGKLPFINLFPMYANEQQLGNPTYKEHIEQFLDTVKPVYTSVDIYPLNSSGLYGGYMRNLDIVAYECRKRGIELSVYIQSVSFAASKRTPSYADLEWQAYCCLSFGAKGIVYFTYMTPYSTAENFLPALIDHDLNKTDRWYYAQKLNAELKLLAKELDGYVNLGAFNFGNTAATDFLDFDNQYDFSAVIKNIESDEPLLFGCFEKDGEYAFTLVNCGDLQSDCSSTVKLRTNAAVTVIHDGKANSTVTPDSDGYVKISLGTGEGVFVKIG